MTLPLPTEHQEQKVLVQYLRLKKYPHFRVPNETYTKSIKQKAANTALGVSAGVPDLFVIVPVKYLRMNGERIKLAVQGEELVAIEMKRAKPAKTSVSKHQQKWLQQLSRAGITSKVCYGADEAIKFIDDITEGRKPTE